jgi:hypothetical protein
MIDMNKSPSWFTTFAFEIDGWALLEDAALLECDQDIESHISVHGAKISQLRWKRDARDDSVMCDDDRGTCVLSRTSETHIACKTPKLALHPSMGAHAPCAK